MAAEVAEDRARLKRLDFNDIIARDGHQLLLRSGCHGGDWFSRGSPGDDFWNDEFFRALVGWRERALINPRFDRGDFRRIELFAFARRHDLLFALSLDPSFNELNQQAL